MGSFSYLSIRHWSRCDNVGSHADRPKLKGDVVGQSVNTCLGSCHMCLKRNTSKMDRSADKYYPSSGSSW